jgi:sulfur transfer complex TusBCD TusB component (DsrH family)
MITKDGVLYAATIAPAGSAALIEKRSAAGTWSTELTSADTTNVNYYDSLVKWQNVIYAQYAGGAVIRVVKQDSVGTWSTDKDMAAGGSTETWGFRATPGLLYASAPPRVFTKSGAVWSTSLSDADLTHGMLI